MRVFVAGATGVLGRRVVPLLVAAGHDVAGLARSAEKAAALRAQGATAVIVDLFDPAALKEAVQGCDAVVNLATHIPPLTRAAVPGAWDENERIRTEGSRNLVDAALAAGATRYVQESIAFVYPDRGDEWLDEEVPLDATPFSVAVRAAEAQAQRATDEGTVGVVLRFGQFQAPDATHSRSQVAMARTGLHPLPGAPGGYAATIHIDDAARAVVAALAAPAGAYNVVDDQPLTRTQIGEAFTAAVGRRRVLSPPAVALKVAGPSASLLARSQRVSNRRFKQATGWAPSFPSMRETVPELVAAMPPPDRRATAERVLLGALAFVALQLGVWATFFPASWYADFPGGGRAWVRLDGPYNEHLVRDFGSLNLALFVLTLVALLTAQRALVRTAAVAWIVYSLPHLVYHARHLDVYGTGDAVANVVTLGSAVVGPIAILLLDRRRATLAPSGHRALGEP